MQIGFFKSLFTEIIKYQIQQYIFEYILDSLIKYNEFLLIIFSPEQLELANFKFGKIFIFSDPQIIYKILK